MEDLRVADAELSSVRRFVSINLSLHQDKTQKHQEKQLLTFTGDEEQVLEEKVSDGIAAYRRAFSDAQDSIQELPSPKEAIEANQELKMHRKKLQGHVVECRKMLVAYRHRAKLERLEQQRKSLLPSSTRGTKVNKGGSGSSAGSSGSVVDVTVALKRTRQVMSQEIERVSSVTKVLDDGRLSLKSSHDEYSNVNAEIVEVRKRLKVLEWQAKQDRMWIGAGITVLISTVLYIVYERTGFIFL
uniref:Sec20 C-terminal domain-containing protein n=1 Tax=Peronospora matthiolae TaxID=2874970 RepID=A0AAV1U6C1_9STRA